MRAGSGDVQLIEQVPVSDDFRLAIRRTLNPIRGSICCPDDCQDGHASDHEEEHT